MTSYSIEMATDAPAFIVTILKSWQTAVDGPAVVSQIITILDDSSEPLYSVSDLGEASLGVSDIIQLANLLVQSKELLRHPKLLGTLVVAESDIIKLAAEGMSSDTFGNIPVRVFSTLEEALNYARKA